MKKMIICLCLGLMLICGCAANDTAVNYDEHVFELNMQELTYELGETIEEDWTTYVNLAEGTVIEDITINTSSLDTELNAGEYRVIYSSGRQEEVLKVIITDTTAPVFEESKDTIKLNKGESIDISKTFKASDLSTVTVTLDDKEVDYDKKGEYKATVTATDASGNKASMEVSVVVKEKETASKNTTSANKTTSTNKTDTANKTTDKTNTTNKDTTSKDTETKTEREVVYNEYGVPYFKDVDKTGFPEIKETIFTSEVPISGLIWTDDGKYIIVDFGEGYATFKYNTDGSRYRPNQKPDDYYTPQLSRETFDLMNKEREKVGLEPYIWSEKLEEGVLIRAQEASEKWSHVRPDGTMYSTVMNFETKYGGENLVQCDTPEEAIEAWMDSPSHRAAILDERFEYAAVGFYGGYFCCLFYND